MFTGLIEEIGTIQAISEKGDGAEVSVAASLVLSDVSLGDSISVSGVCLTVTHFDTGTLCCRCDEGNPQSIRRCAVGAGGARQP